ncbi:hypothetical protein EX30DRAFT_361811 [Ascodesmis nigricans]|uniref:Uncharacterized protein n=1 Tax=Ascodesmis nigricans TaxID=341454 RepID=A0A4S2N3M8_9PEZI|nr:hypothetical protein EX30DRAFT_361811 [Ascodesmis nigricans]
MYSHNPDPRSPILHPRHLRQLFRHRFNPTISRSLTAIKSHPTYLRRRFTTHLTAIILRKRLQQRRYALKLSKLGDNETITSALAREVDTAKRARWLRSGEVVDVSGSGRGGWWDGEDEFDIPDGQPRSWNEGLEEGWEKSVSDVSGTGRAGGAGGDGGDGDPNGGGDEDGEKWDGDESDSSPTASEDEERDDVAAENGEEATAKAQDEPSDGIGSGDGDEESGKKANSRVASPSGSPNGTKSTSSNLSHSDRVRSPPAVSATTPNAPNLPRTSNPASFSSTSQQRHNNSQNHEQESVFSSVSTDSSDAQQSSLGPSTLQSLYSPTSSPESQGPDNNSDSESPDIPDAQRSSPSPIIGKALRSATASPTNSTPKSPEHDNISHPCSTDIPDA